MAVPIREGTGQQSPSRSYDAIALDSAPTRAGLHDCHLEPSIRLDVVYTAADGFASCEPCSNPNYVLIAHRRPDVSLPLSRVISRQVRPEGTAVAGRRADRIELVARCTCVDTFGTVSHLWAPRWRRHRHRIYRRDRSYGPVVS